MPLVEQDDHTIARVHVHVPDTWSDLLHKQEQREDAGVVDGYKRFQQMLDAGARYGINSSTGAAHALLRSGIERIATVFEAALVIPRLGVTACTSGITAKCRNNPSTLERWLPLMESHGLTAYLVLRTLLDQTAAGGQPALTSLALETTNALLAELKYRRLKTLNPNLFRYTTERLRTPHLAHTKRVMDSAVHHAAIDCSDLDLNTRERVLLGNQLIDCALDALPGWFTVAPGDVSAMPKKRSRKSPRTPPTVVQLAPEMLLKLARSNELLALTRPVYGPMVVPPLPWRLSGIRGGFRYALREQLSLVATTSRRVIRRIEVADIPEVLAAVNATQETAWVVNRDVLAVVRELVSLGGGYCGIPASLDAELPPKPEDIAINENARKEWRHQAHQVHGRNRLRRSEANALEKVLAVAEEVRDEAAIWFTWSVDFRGRLYPRSSYLSPQGSDVTRALLTFGEALPVDADARKWLAIHGANCLGATSDGHKISQMTFAERVAYIERIESEILALAADPLDVPGLMLLADKPWMFLAFCLDWARLLGAEARGETYYSSLPVSVDGTANGLQHYSALTRDTELALKVNVIPSADGRPVDIYSTVAVALIDKLTALALTGDPMARQWIATHTLHGALSRKLTKAPAMTKAYGSGRFAFRLQMHDHFQTLSNATEIAAHFVTSELPTPAQAFERALTYLAGVVASVIDEQIGIAADAMQWMKRCGRTIAKAAGTPVQWRTPLGFPVVLPYQQLGKQAVTSVLGGRIVKNVLHPETPAVDVRKQASGLAPSVIHSLDSTHLMLTVNAAVSDEGIESFSLLHDSYGTQAANCSILARILREQFATLYSVDVLDDLYQQFAAQLPDPSTCLKPPVRGRLDVVDCLESEYLFA